MADKFYHIYNRAIGNEQLFRRDEDYLRWLADIKKYIIPLVELHAYCLMPNHYHLLIRIKENTEPLWFSKAMSDAANSYCKWYNNHCNRKGSLFTRPFKRKVIEDEHQLAWTCWYIHQNPMHHGYTNDWQTWKFSSYSAYISVKPSNINRDLILSFFGGREALQAHHLLNATEPDFNLITIE